MKTLLLICISLFLFNHQLQAQTKKTVKQTKTQSKTQTKSKKKQIKSKKSRPKRQDWTKRSVPSKHKNPEAIGGYSYGCILGAKAVPSKGVGYQTIRRERNRYYGHPFTLKVIQEIGKIAHENQLSAIEIGDLSQPVGGLMAFGHKSHQIGLDIDIWFGISKALDQEIKEKDFEKKHPPMIDRKKEEIDPHVWDDQRHLLLLKTAASQSEVNRIFVHWAIKKHLCQQYELDKKNHQEQIKHSAIMLDELSNIPTTSDESETELIQEEGELKLNTPAESTPTQADELPKKSTIDEKWQWISKIRPWYGHDQHFHIRLSCPKDNALCEGQGTVRGLGCEELELKKFSHRYQGWVKIQEDALKQKREEELAKLPPLTEAQKAEKIKKNKELQEIWLKQRATVNEKCNQLLEKPKKSKSPK